MIQYPTLIDDVPAPTLRAYPKATVIAEKLHAVCLFGMTNSRMKDFSDLWVLLRDPTVNDDELRQAVSATFARRNTPLPNDLPVGLSDAFAADKTKQTQWHAFLKKNRLDSRDLAEVVRLIRTRFLRLGFGS